MATEPWTDARSSTRRSALAAATAGDQRCWDRLVERYAQHAWDTARSHGLGISSAAAICQLAWMRLADHLDEVSTEVELRDWLGAAIEREALSLPHPERFS